jgi:hypothetical protein
MSIIAKVKVAIARGLRQQQTKVTSIVQFTRPSGAVILIFFGGPIAL